MGVGIILVVAIAILVGFQMMAPVVDIAGAFNLAVDTPLYDIVQLLPIAFLGLIIIGCLWVVGRGM